MKTGNGNAPRESALPRPAERYWHSGRSRNIANLPAEIRDELNYRISDGDPGNELVEWLNSKPEVAEVVNKLFDGRPISEQCTARKRYFQDVAERSLHRGRSLKTSPNGKNAATRSGSRTAISSMNPTRFPTTPQTSLQPALTATNSFSPSPRLTPRRRRTGSSRPASKCSTSWPFTKISPTA
jgi:hypothetical protein